MSLFVENPRPAPAREPELKPGESISFTFQPRPGETIQGLCRRLTDHLLEFSATPVHLLVFGDCRASAVALETLRQNSGTSGLADNVGGRRRVRWQSYFRNSGPCLHRRSRAGRVRRTDRGINFHRWQRAAMRCWRIDAAEQKTFAHGTNSAGARGFAVHSGAGRL